MSYDIDLTDPITEETLILEQPHQMKGGTFAVGGCRHASLNITYNYADHYLKVLGPDGIRTIYGMTGGESIQVLKQAVDQLSDNVSEDYWEPTEGNAKAALLQLMALAQMRPDGVWKGD